MKKFTLVSLAMMASASCFAQTTLWNGEDKNSGLWDRCNPTTVDNPLKEGVNTSDKCAKFTITGNDWEHGDIVLDLKSLYGEGGLDMTKSKRLSIMVKKSHASNVKIELSAGANTYTKRIASWCDGGDKWQKLVFDFTTNCDFEGKGNPTELAIYPGIEEGQEGSQEIYVDDIVLEDIPTVNGGSLWDAADGSLTDNLELTGGYFKTECSNVDNGWEKIYIDDFARLNNKLSANVTSIDMRKASTLGVDINQFFKNPNTIVYANQYYDRGDNNYANIVVNTIAKSLELTEKNTFNAPENFTAETVKLTRGVQDNINSFVLPFYVSAEDLGCKVATYKGCDADKYANFETVDGVGANTPFLTIGAKEASELTFTNKGIVATPDNLGTDFVGVYTRTNANGFYGINGDGKLQKGGADAYVNPFHAYLNVDKKLEAVAFDGSTVTAINGIAADNVADTAVYDLSGRRVNGKLQKGLYIMNGKKVVVK